MNSQTEIQVLQEHVRALTDELSETNRGVVALYAELDDRAQLLAEISELKSRFLSYMSHEFQTPIGSIISLARILKQRLDGDLTPEQEKQLELILSSAEELLQLVQDLLDLAKIEAGKITVSPAWFEMVDLFAALRGIFRPILTSFVTLTFEDPSESFPVYTDHKKLSQVLRNFISNALKFTKEGSVVVKVKRDGDFVTFFVTDTGIGIRQEDQAALFNDFVQIDSPIQKHLRGSGLGLALCHRMAELLGGSVGVESDYGVGSTFWITIPIEFEGGKAVQDQTHVEAMF